MDLRVGDEEREKDRSASGEEYSVFVGDV